MSLRAIGDIERTIQAVPSSIRATKDFYKKQYLTLVGSASNTDWAAYYALAIGGALSPFLTPFGGAGVGFILGLLAENTPTDRQKFTTYTMDSETMLASLATKLDGLVSPNGIAKFDIKFTYKQFKNDKDEVYGVPYKYQITAYYNSNGDKTLAN